MCWEEVCVDLVEDEGVDHLEDDIHGGGCERL